jgi:hypothetical protein
LFQDRSIAIYCLNLNSVIPSIGLLRSYHLDLRGSIEFCALHSLLLVMDDAKAIAYRISDRFQSDRVYCSDFFANGCAMGDSVVYVIDDVLVVMSPGYSFPLNQRIIVSETDRIVHLVTSLPFFAVIFVTEAGNMKIVSAATSAVIGFWHFENETVQKLLVTEHWGFVVVKTDRRLYTFTIAGLLLEQCEFSDEITHWTTFTTAGCVDAVILVTGEMKLMFFEAFHPARIQSMKTLNRGIVGMRVSRQRDILVLVTADGFVVLSQLPDVRSLMIKHD